MKEKKREKGEKGAFPVIGGSSIVTALGREDVMRVEGVKKVLLCHESEIQLRVKEGTLRICGKRLICITYTSGAVEITGRIEKWQAEGRDTHDVPIA